MTDVRFVCPYCGKPVETAVGLMVTHDNATGEWLCTGSRRTPDPTTAVYPSSPVASSPVGGEQHG